jgi:hypothetical protein
VSDRRTFISQSGTGNERGKLRFAAMLSWTSSMKLKKARDHKAAGKIAAKCRL